MKLLSYESAGELCGMSKWWIMQQVKDGKLRVLHFGNRHRIRMEDFEDFVKTLTASKLYLVRSK